MADVDEVRSPSGAAPLGSAPGLLAQLFLILERSGSLKLNFEDLTGISYDLPDLKLGLEHRIHCGAFCRLAKSNLTNHLDCQRNKLVCNRLVSHRGEGFRGMCHLGLTELVEPLLSQGRVLGVFFFGSVVLRGSERAGRERIRAYAAKRGISAQPLLDTYALVPRISQQTLEEERDRLKTVVALAGRIIEAHGLPLERYRTQASAVGMRHVPPLIQAAMRRVQREYSESITVEKIAEALHCHPDYLSRAFKRAARIGLADYILRVRVDHARNLIKSGTLSLGEIAWQVGFLDQSHFNRVFKRLVGMTPGDYRTRG